MKLKQLRDLKLVKYLIFFLNLNIKKLQNFQITKEL